MAVLRKTFSWTLNKNGRAIDSILAKDQGKHCQVYTKPTEITPIHVCMCCHHTTPLCGVMKYYIKYCNNGQTKCPLVLRESYTIHEANINGFHIANSRQLAEMELCSTSSSLYLTVLLIRFFMCMSLATNIAYSRHCPSVYYDHADKESCGRTKQRK